jgi:hypothetical protein
VGEASHKALVEGTGQTDLAQETVEVRAESMRVVRQCKGDVDVDVSVDAGAGAGVGVGVNVDADMLDT